MTNMDSSTEIHHQSVEEEEKEEEKGTVAECDPESGHLLRLPRQTISSPGVFPVDKSGFCFLCTNTGEVLSGGRFSVQSIRCLFRYLEMDTKKKEIVARGRGMGGGLRGPEYNCQFKVNLCEECAGLNEQFTELYGQLERIQMEVDSCLERVETKLKAEMEQSQSRRTLPDWVQTVKGLREEAVKKCVRKRGTFSPRVRVESLAIAEVTQPQLSLRREETSREETKVQSDLDMNSRRGIYLGGTNLHPDMNSSPCEVQAGAVTGMEILDEIKTESSPEPLNVSEDEAASPQPIPRNPSGDMAGEDEDKDVESDAFSLYEGRDSGSDSDCESNHSEDGEPKTAAPPPVAATMTPKPSDVDSSPSLSPHEAGRETEEERERKTASSHEQKSQDASEDEDDAAEDEESDDNVSLYEARDSEMDSDYDSESDSESSHSEDGEAESTPPPPDPATATMIAPKVTVKPSETGPQMDEDEIKTEILTQPKPCNVPGNKAQGRSAPPLDAATMTTTAPKDNDTKKPSPIVEPSPLSAEEIEQRSRFNSETGQYKCRTCGKSYAERGGFFKHYKSAHLGLKVTCEICGKVFSDNGSYLKHFKRAHLNVLYECSVCKKSFSKRFTYQQHYKAVHMKVKLKCGVCNKTVSGKANLWLHEKYSCKDNPKSKGKRPKPKPKPKEPGFRQLCETCGKAFSREGNFKRHVTLEFCKKDKDKDKEPVEKKKPGPPKKPVPEEGFSWVCHICGRVIQSKKYKGYLAKHVKRCKKRNGMTD